MAQTQPRKTTRTRTPRTPRKKAPSGLASMNPRTGETVAEIPTTDPAEVPEIIAQARKVAPEWASIDPRGRAKLMSEVRHHMYDMADKIAEVVAEETGKPIEEAYAHDVVPGLLMLQSFEKLAPKALKPRGNEAFKSPIIGKMLTGSTTRVEFRPFGVVGCITPWNYPITNCFLAFLSPLFAGNVVVIKPSEVTPRCGELIREILEPLPSGVATVIQGGGDVGAALVDAPCDKISFIGSPPTGRKICEAAAKHLTPVVMELGGKDAAIVCDDADVDIATSGIVWGSFFNAGQTCCSIERIYVTDAVADEFKDQLLSKLGKVEQGREIGSLTFKPQLTAVAKQVEDAVKKGARVLAGGPNAGKKNTKGSLWYAPTVLESVTDEMDVLKNESFGPIVTITRVRDEDEAIRRANEEAVNLTASVWTKNSGKAYEISSRLKAGNISINQHGENPASAWGTWGGVGESGFGRLNGEFGLLEFTVPVFIQKSQLPMKRAFWYPYDEPTLGLLRSAAALLGARTAGERLKGAAGVAKNFRASLKNKI